MNENIILNTALQTISLEIEALQKLKSSIDHNFEKIIETIYQSSGRLVVTGIGKSAIVAKKIVATLNSTGTPSLFMHAADAIHGDLGMIASSDIVLCLSKSGETAEVKVLLPLVKNLGNTIIGMTSSTFSTLSQQADFTIITPIDQEADPNNLAPTASTTVQMALGDAMATALLALRGFTAQDFAKFHPGGSLGKQLYLKVQDIYIYNERPSVLLDASLEEVIVEISSKRLGATAVVNTQHQLEGIITDGDLRRMLSKYSDTNQLTAQEIMTPHPKTTAPTTLAVKAFQAMRENSITQLIVEENNIYKGIIHLHDLIREGIV